MPHSAAPDPSSNASLAWLTRAAAGQAAPRQVRRFWRQPHTGAMDPAGPFGARSASRVGGRSLNAR
jgi:hypothetical protein